MSSDTTDTPVERGAAEEGSPLTPTEVEASRRPPSEPGADQPTGAAPPMSSGDSADAPLLTGDDVRLGPEQTDEPQAGATEPTD